MKAMRFKHRKNDLNQSYGRFTFFGLPGLIEFSSCRRHGDGWQFVMRPACNRFGIFPRGKREEVVFLVTPVASFFLVVGLGSLWSR